MDESTIGKTKSAGWQIGVSRTIPVPLDDAWSYLVSAAGLAVWLGRGIETPLHVGDEYRTVDGTHGEITWQSPDRPDDATVQIAVTPAAAGCTLRFTPNGSTTATNASACANTGSRSPMPSRSSWPLLLIDRRPVRRSLAGAMGR